MHIMEQRLLPTQSPARLESRSKNFSPIQDFDSTLLLDNVTQVSTKAYLAVLTVCVIYFAQICNIVGAGAQAQQIAADLNGGPQSVWITSSIAIVTVVLSPIVSQAADYWGRKWFLVVLTSFGAIGSLIVSRATSMTTAIAGFSITGVAYGAQPLLHAISSEVLPRRYRSYGQAADLTANALGGVAGLLVGGALNPDPAHPKSFSFRTFWYMCTGIFLAATMLAIFLYKPLPTHNQNRLTTREKLADLDWVGYCLLSSGIVLFSVGLSYSENPYPWSNGHVSATFAIGLMLMISLCFYEVWFKHDGMFHHGLFRAKNFTLALICIFCEGAAFFAANQYFVFQTAVLYGNNNINGGLRYSLSMIVSIPVALLAGLVCATTKTVRWITVVGFATFIGFFICMSVAGLGDAKNMWGYPLLLGAALGTTLCALITVAQLSAPPELIALATGLVISFRSLGGAVGLAIYNALFTNGMNGLGGNIARSVEPLGVPPDRLGQFLEAFMKKDTNGLLKIPGVTPQVLDAAGIALRKTYLASFRHVWIAACCFVAVAGIVAINLRDPKDQFTMKIDAPMDKESERQKVLPAESQGEGRTAVESSVIGS